MHDKSGSLAPRPQGEWMTKALALAEMPEIDHRVPHPPTNAFFFEGMSFLQHCSEACQGVLHSTASTLDLM